MLDLYDQWKDCQRCTFHKMRNKVVFGSGNYKDPKILIVGEAPGPEEDKTGIPFYGTTGSLLRRTLEDVGINHERDCFITNSVLCFPTIDGKRFRPPAGEEIRTCLPRMESQIAAIHPSVKVILLTGARALASFLYPKMLADQTLDKEHAWSIIKVNKLIGWHDIPAYAPARIFVTYHPSFISRSGANVASLLFVNWRNNLREVKKYALD